MQTFIVNLAAFQFRNDDGSESAATPKAAVNTTISMAVAEVLRCRILVQETNGGSANNQSFTWQYRHVEGTNTWTNLTTSSSIVQAANSQLVDDTSTTSGTHDLNGTGTFIVDNGAQCEDGITLVPTADFQGSDHVDCELSFQILDAGTANGDRIDFRVLVGGTAPAATTEQAYLTVSKANYQEADADAAGLSEALGESESVATAGVDADSAGLAEALGETGALKGVDADSAGTSEALGEAAAITLVEGSSDGVSSVTGDSGTVVAAEGSSAGTSVALGEGVGNSSAAPFNLSPSTGIAPSGEDTTPQLTPPDGQTTGDFGGGRIQDDENPTDPVTLGANEYREDEWSIIPNVGALDSYQYEFRVLVDGIVVETISQIPKWTLTVGTTVIPADGSSAGVADALGISGALKGALGYSSGLSEALGETGVIFSSVGESDGSSDALGESGVIFGSVGESSSSSEALGKSGVIAGVDADAAGTSVVLAQASDVGADGVDADAAGTSSVIGISGSISGSEGDAQGDSVVVGVSGSISGSVGSSIGQSVVDGVTGASLYYETVAESDGSSVVDGISGSINQVLGISAGSAVVDGFAASLQETVGYSSGLSVVLGETARVRGSDADSSGLSVVLGYTNVLAASKFNIIGSSLAEWYSGSTSGSYGESIGTSLVLGVGADGYLPAKTYLCLESLIIGADLEGFIINPVEIEGLIFSPVKISGIIINIIELEGLIINLVKLEGIIEDCQNV